jgi:hypothetical protein
MTPVQQSTQPMGLPWLALLILSLPVIKDAPARLVAYGLTHPHVRSPQLSRAA